ncbi:MAG: trypsin-like peptidase domain-containing protein [Flavobacteriales bacterium]|nr:trypsin-like peptidase domain-containing protein [Flavobacteriales bacterium]
MMRTWTVAAALLLFGYGRAQDLSGDAIYERCAGAIMQIGVRDDLGRMQGTGSGIVLKDSAWLLTNHHIFEHGGYLMAEKDGEPLDITGGIVRADAKHDVLILKIKPEIFPELWKKIPDLDVVLFDQLKRGQRVYAIGNPADLETTITDGLISGLRMAEDTASQLVQISAPISPGSSGGGVFDGQGRLIGMTSFIMRPRSTQNLNFALPMDQVLFWDRTDTRHDISETKWHPQFIAGYEAWKAHDCNLAAAHFRMVPDGDPTRGRALYFTARCLQHTGKNGPAKDLYERAVKVDPRLARAHLYLASILLSEGEVEHAMEHQSKAYALEPGLREVKVTKDDW